MFYADFVLSKKGPLARIWLAAHWDRKLTKSQVFETNIEKSVDGILQPSVKIALRTSGHLLLGVVRIYSRKAKYLLADCNEAFVKIKMAFRPGMVDLPEDHKEAAVNAVTLPEVFHDFDTSIPDFKYVWNDLDLEMQFSANQSRVDEITMREELAQQQHHHGGAESYPQDAFEASSLELLRQSAAFEQSLQQATLMLAGREENERNNNRLGGMSFREINGGDDIIGNRDHFGDLDMSTGGIFDGGLFEDTPMPDVPRLEGPIYDDDDHDDANEHGLFGGASPMLHASPRSCQSGDEGVLNVAKVNDVVGYENAIIGDDDDGYFPADLGGDYSPSSDGSRPPSPLPGEDRAVDMPIALEREIPSVEHKSPEDEFVGEPGGIPLLPEGSPEEDGRNDRADQTTLINNEETTFALLPVDASALKGFTKTKRKRKLIVDEVKNISGEEMKAQLSDTTDIVTTLDLAPPTKRLMHWKETGGVEKLFALPGKAIPARGLAKNYQRHLTSRQTLTEDGGDEHAEMDVAKENIPPLEGGIDGNIPAPGPANKRGRKRKQIVEEVVDGHVEEKGRIEEEADQEAPPLKKTTIRMSPAPHIEQKEDQQPEMVPHVPNEITPMEIDGIIEHDASIAQPCAMIPPSEGPQSVLPSEMPINEDLEQQEQRQLLDEEELRHEEEIIIVKEVDGVLESLKSPPNESFVAANADLGQQHKAAEEEDEEEEEEEEEFLEDHQAKRIRTEPEQLFEDQIPLEEQRQAQMEGEDEEGLNQIHGAAQGGGGYTPWHDDYENPQSVGQFVEQTEQVEDHYANETAEQFEERVLNKRACSLYHSIRMRLCTEDTTYFTDLITDDPRKQVAQKFYSLLVLKKHRVLDLTQEAPYAEILLTRGSNFDDPKL